MGLFSNVLNRVKSGLPQAIEDRRGPGSGIGSLMAKPDLEPRGGGFLKRAARNVNQQLRPQPQQNPMLPIMPPSIPGSAAPTPSIDIREYLDQQKEAERAALIAKNLASFQDRIGEIPRTATGDIDAGKMTQMSTDYSEAQRAAQNQTQSSRFAPLTEYYYKDENGATVRVRATDPNEAYSRLPESVKQSGNFGTSAKDLAEKTGLNLLPFQTKDEMVSGGLQNIIPPKRISDQIPIDDRPIPRPSIGGIKNPDGTIRGMPPPPLPPQDFGFGPGIRPTEMIGPDGQFIGSGGVTPPTPDPRPMIDELPPERIAEIIDPIPVTDPVVDAVTPPAPLTPPAPVTPPASTTVAANQPPVTDPAPVVEPSPTQTTAAPPQVPGGTPYAAGVTQIQSGLDPLTEQLLFGLGGQGGFIPGAMRAAEKVFYDDQGQPVVIDEQVAGFSPDQLAAMQMQRQSLGMQDPYLQGAAGAYGSGTQALEEGLQRGRTAAIGALGATRRGVGSLQRGLGESADILRGTVGGYDPSMTERFYDPYEDRVVQQTVKDIMEQGAKADIGARAGDIARGGESAFGSRARLGAGERQEALGRGLAEAVSGIRSQGFREAQQTGLGEFARQKAAERAASTGLAGLAGQGFGGSQALAGALTGLGGTEQQIGQQRYSGQFGLGSSLQGLGAQAAGASASDIASLYGMGSQQQGQAQQMLDAQRRNLQQRQMTPLLQYQALAPFVGMAPAGQFQTTTQFAPKPSAMQAGLGTGLSAFGALGQLYGGSKT